MNLSDTWIVQMISIGSCGHFFYNFYIFHMPYNSYSAIDTAAAQFEMDGLYGFPLLITANFIKTGGFL